MDHQDANVSDVVIVLIENPGVTCAAAAEQLRGLGLEVCDVDDQNGVIEGTICSEKIAAVKKLPFIETVRSVFTYTADYPPGDPRNLDTDQDDGDSADCDDAGA